MFKTLIINIPPGFMFNRAVSADHVRQTR